MPTAPPDPALGVYETLLLAGGRVHALEEHLRRLESSVSELYGFPLPATVRAELRDLSPCHGPQPEQRLRVDVVPRGGRLELTFTQTPLHPRSRDPQSLRPVTVPGGIGAHKWRDRRLIESFGTDPSPLLTDADGTVLEVAWGNVFVLDGTRLATPPLDGRILPGVTRQSLLKAAPALGLEPEERPISLAEVERAPTVIVTSSLRLAVAAGCGRAPAEEPEIVGRIRQALF